MYVYTFILEHVKSWVQVKLNESNKRFGVSTLHVQKALLQLHWEALDRRSRIRILDETNGSVAYYILYIMISTAPPSQCRGVFGKRGGFSNTAIPQKFVSVSVCWASFFARNDSSGLAGMEWK